MIAPADFGYLCVLKASTQACRQLQPFQVILAPHHRVCPPSDENLIVLHVTTKRVLLLTGSPGSHGGPCKNDI